MALDKRLAGKVALITGAASGIGLACAKRFAQEGAVTLGLDLQATPDWDQVEDVAPASDFFVTNVCNFAMLQDVVATVLKKHARIDILVTAAGVATGGPVHLLPEEEWDRVLDVNLKGTFLTAKAVLPAMVAQRAGSVITLGSVEGIVGMEGGSAYNASKGGVILLTKNMALDYAGRGIRVNCICPGFIETPLMQAAVGAEALAAQREKILYQHKLGRFGRPEEIAGAAFFLASEDSSFMTGQSLVIDGGYIAGLRVGFAELMGLGPSR